MTSHCTLVFQCCLLVLKVVTADSESDSTHILYHPISVASVIPSMMAIHSAMKHISTPRPPIYSYFDKCPIISSQHCPPPCHPGIPFSSPIHIHFMPTFGG
ncbi:hypothetical protein FRX31_024317 [Thalictrum thalictroides]|uniref:Secreted protein n=1 Tax=Thalictrum thalictroides TaxID=46969 RepID=A0A7J6VLW2_THATH|nr:hypothetical protein FRX31_024317 [Thalictrum thalictroides]